MLVPAFCLVFLPTKISRFPELFTACFRINKKWATRELKEVAAGFGINTENLTFYSARHSYATALDREGVSRAVISQALGHSSVKTTEIYLAAFGDSVVDEADGLLG